MGYMHINIVHAPVKLFQRVLPGFGVIVKRKTKIWPFGAYESQFFFHRL